MDIYIDDVKIDFTLIGTETFEEIINGIKNFVQSEGRVVSEVFIDGENIESIEMINFENIKKIDFFTLTPRNIMLETLQELNLYIDKLSGGIKSIIEHLASDEEREAMEIILQAINGLEWVHDVIHAVGSITNLADENKEFFDIFSRYKKNLETVVESLENKDMIMLSDVLEYEVLENIEDIKSILPMIYDCVLNYEKNKNKVN